jgi:hypothetical protein
MRLKLVNKTLQAPAAEIAFRVLGKLNSKLIILAGTFLQLPLLTLNLSEGDSFRYSQTTLVIREFMLRGFDQRTPLPIFGAQSYVPFEFPLFQGIAAFIGNSMHLSPTTAARLTGLICFQLTAFVVSKLALLWFSKKTAVISIFFFEFSPFGLKFGHAPMIEFLAILLILSGVLLFENSQAQVNGSMMYIFYLLSSLCLVSGALVKTTTAAALFFLLLIPMVHGLRYLQNFIHKIILVAWCVLSVGGSIATSLIWNRLADSYKSDNPLTSYLRLDSAEMQRWTLGTLQQRFAINTWRDILFHYLGPICVGILFLLILSYFPLLNVHNRRTYFFLLSVCGIPMVLFTNLYVSHEYYVAAIFPILVILMGRSIEILVSKFDLGSSFVVFFCALILAGSYNSKIGLNYIGDVIGHRSIPALVFEIQEKVPKNRTVLFLGCDWNPEIPFYANRPSLMVPEWKIMPKQSDLDQVAYIAFCDFVPVDREIELIKYFGSSIRAEKVSDNIYRLFR